MALNPFKVTFKLDGTGVYFDPSEPLHLDALLAYALAPFHCKGEPPSRNDEPFDIPLPLGKWHRGGTWGWHASALFPDGDQFDSLQYWRKRFRQSRIEMTEGSPNLQMGTMRDYSTPMPLILCSEMVAYGLGNRRNVYLYLKKHVHYLGKKRAFGKGKVLDIKVELIEQDYSCMRDGLAMRWLPKVGAARIVRPRPPYWNNCGKVECCEVGENF